ncbi:IS630 family transposase [Cognatishimia sp.]|uniref:IS630 family transposase n=1 Tax=Cognatishimia sp. TaxID=2211648 RepID=UPI0035133D16|nr:IS630 family transposase [Cognatishimia sp.]
MTRKNKGGRPKAPLALDDDTREHLERIVRAPTSAQRDVLRARMILLSAQGLTNQAVGASVGVTGQTVGKWRRRFIEFGVAGLTDAPRPKESLRLSDRKVTEIVRATLETKPRGATHWSTRLMAKHAGVSQSSVSKIWRAFHLKPHRTSTFSLSNDPNFAAKVRDVVGLYMNPPDHAVVLCVDEKSQIQALERGQLVLPMTIGHSEKATPTYMRHGTTSLFAALDVATGHVIGKCYQQHRSEEFLKFLKLIDREVPKDLEVHLVLDNLSTHNTPAVLRWRRRHSRFHFHFTPTYSSWLNLVERWFGLLTERQLKRGVHRSTVALERAIREFIDAHNEDPKPFIWTKTADQILASVSRLCEQLLERKDMQRKADSGH